MQAMMKLRQIEVQAASGKGLALACKEAKLWNTSLLSHRIHSPNSKFREMSSQATQTCPRRNTLAHRFYFDLTYRSSSIRDDVGVEARDIDQAVEEAQVVIEEMRGRHELASLEDWNMAIRDESGATLMTLPLTQDN